MSKQFEIFNMLKNGFTNSFSLLPVLKELYDEVESLSEYEIGELKKNYPKIAEILERIKSIID